MTNASPQAPQKPALRARMIADEKPGGRGQDPAERECCSPQRPQSMMILVGGADGIGVVATGGSGVACAVGSGSERLGGVAASAAIDSGRGSPRGGDASLGLLGSSPSTTDDMTTERIGDCCVRGCGFATWVPIQEGWRLPRRRAERRCFLDTLGAPPPRPPN